MTRGLRRSVVAVVVLLLSCSGINSVSNSYATLDEARQAGAVEDGTVPGWLPPGSHDLREVHVPGSPSLWGIVNFPIEEAEALRAALDPAEVPLDGIVMDAPKRIEWWPIELRGTLDGERLSMVGLRAYHSRDHALIVAVNWKQGRGYYWRASD